MAHTISLSVVIPSYNRGKILLETLSLLDQQAVKPAEVLIIDQTRYQRDDPIAKKLSELQRNGIIVWRQLTHPSIPAAMNVGLQMATSSHVLFLDDDVTFTSDFIQQHLTAIKQYNVIAHVGQIIQPWQHAVPTSQASDVCSVNKQSFNSIETLVSLNQDLDFPFNGNEIAAIYNCMAGNLCVNRQLAINAGGFDEHFSGAAYRFETEFCRRFIAYAAKPFLFIPSATLNHLHIKQGGTRAWAASHLTSISSVHSRGDYYFALRQGLNGATVLYVLKRLFGSLLARFYLTKPWWLPVRFIAELRGLFWAIRQISKQPKLIDITRISD